MTGRVLFVAAGADAGEPGALAEAFDVDVAEGAVDAIKQLSVAAESPDCVVAHAAVRDLPLDAFLDRVARTTPDSAIVVVGGLPTDADVAEALVEADAYVPPGRQEDLVERVRRAVGERRVDAAIDRHEGLLRVFAEVAVAVTAAPDREAVEAAVYDLLVEGSAYRQVWVARVDDGGGIEVTVPMASRLAEADVQDLAGGHDPSFVEEAVERGEVVATEGRVTTRGAAATPSLGTLQDGGRSRSNSTAAVPFVHGGRVLGLGLVSTGRGDAFDASERELLSDLGAVVGHALARVDETDELARPARAGAMETLVHEMRNPLGIARAHLEIAREEEDFGSVELAESAVDRAISTVDRVAKGVGAAGDVEPVRVPLSSAAETAWESVSAPEATLDVVDSAVIRADRDMLARLLANLFQNAVDHGGEAVTIRVGTVPEGFFVEDDGPGVAPEDRESVFERGFTTADEGLGIGLSIVDAVTEAHGWTLALSDAGSGGARFEVTGVEVVPEGEAE